MSEYRRQIVIASVVGIVIVLSVGVGIYLSPLQSVQTTSLTSSSSISRTQNSRYEIMTLSGSWHYVGNTSEYFNDICPDSGILVDCEGMGNPPATIQMWSNGTVTAFVGHITVNNDSYSVVIIGNSTYCVTPNVGDRPLCTGNLVMTLLTSTSFISTTQATINSESVTNSTS